MSKPEILLIGAGGHARVCIDVIEQNGEYSISGLVGMPEEVGSEVLGHSVIAPDSDLVKLKTQYHHAMITVGQIQTPAARVRLFSQLSDMGYVFPPIVSPNAYVSKHAYIGAGTIVMHGAVINAGARVGKNCIINSQSLIEHDSNIADHCHISTGVMVNGEVQVGEGSFLGSGSLLREGISLGKHCIVGMGLTVRRSQPNNSRILKVE